MRSILGRAGGGCTYTSAWLPGLVGCEPWAWAVASAAVEGVVRTSPHQGLPSWGPSWVSHAFVEINVLGQPGSGRSSSS